jgi:hypothetical protein
MRRTDRPRRADHDGRLFFDRDLHLTRAAQQARDARGDRERIARRHRDRRTLRDRHARIADDARKRAQAHDLRAEPRRDLDRIEDLLIDRFARQREHRLRHERRGDEPAFGRPAVRRAHARNLRRRIRGHPFHDLLDQARTLTGRARFVSDHVLDRRRMDDEPEFHLNLIRRVLPSFSTTA